MGRLTHAEAGYGEVVVSKVWGMEADVNNPHVCIYVCVCLHVCVCACIYVCAHPQTGVAQKERARICDLLKHPIMFGRS